MQSHSTVFAYLLRSGLLHNSVQEKTIFRAIFRGENAVDGIHPGVEYLAILANIRSCPHTHRPLPATHTARRYVTRRGGHCHS